MILQELPLQIKNKKINIYVNEKTCDVAVYYLLYDRKKKYVINTGESHSLSKNSNYASIHAEQLAIKELSKYNLNKNYDIYIFKYNRSGNLKMKYCCERCTNLIKKINLEKRIFTCNNSKIESALKENPIKSVGDIINLSKIK